ncbi:MAG TPA: FAD-dependent oxidoreductase [Gammaproteobacteria bacterium]|nr:FAD-dependent oxidoreductase [Gammaproteobacteria bacterium]
MDCDCVIIGAGLSGLHSAFRLAQAGMSCRVLEARRRLGGRIACETVPAPDGGSARFDLGPAWVWPDLQPMMARLLNELQVPVFLQATRGAALYEDSLLPAPERVPGDSPHAQSCRIAGGAAALVEALAARLEPQTVLTGRRAIRVAAESGGVRIDFELADGGRGQLHAPHVITALPLRLLADTVTFEPPLPPVQRETFLATPTWMAGHAKFLACYATPFWERQGLSGEVFSRMGPLMEIHDASPVRGGPYGLFGFYGVPAAARRELGREALARHSLEQLERLFGPEAANPIGYRIKDWSEDPLTATAADSEPLMQHPDYGLSPELSSLWDGRVLFAGSETVVLNGGYLEGALEAGESAVAGVIDTGSVGRGR